MVLPAGSASVKVIAQAGKVGIGVDTGQLELDVLVDQLEASVAADLVARRAK
jgi:hypothetical protein